MRKLLPYLKNYKKECIAGPVLKLLEASLELFVPLVVASIIDNGIANGDKLYIIRMCAFMVGLGLAGLLCTVIAQYASAKAASGFAARVRHALFAHVQSFSYADAEKAGISTLITRMTSDVNQVQTGLNLSLRLLLRSPFIIFGAMIMAFTIDVGAALIFAVVIPVLAALVFGIMLRCIPLYKKVQGGIDRVLGTVRENLTGARVIRAFGRESDEEKRFDAQSSELLKTQRTVGRISALQSPLTFVIINIAILYLIYRGGVGVNFGTLTQGQVIALYNYMSQILIELVKLADLIITITKSLSCASRIEEVLSLPAGEKTENGDVSGDEDNEIEFRDVSLRYSEGGDEALESISFTLKKGMSLGVIGGTGSGKSSLVNLIPRFYTATSGNVLFKGKDVKSIPVDLLRSKIGVVPQKALLFRGTLRENLLWGCESASDETLYEALSAAQATDVCTAKGGLDGEIEQGGWNLSGGQRQRLTIARALVKRPEILILDDSASALDFATDAALRKALRNLAYEPTVITVSQRTSSIKHCDLIIVLDDGKAVGLGTHDYLMQNCATYRDIYESQFGKEAHA